MSEDNLPNWSQLAQPADPEQLEDEAQRERYADSTERAHRALGALRDTFEKLIRQLDRDEW